MGKYAERTDVPVSKSREEFENLMKRFGAEQWATRVSAPRRAPGNTLDTVGGVS